MPIPFEVRGLDHDMPVLAVTRWTSVCMRTVLDSYPFPESASSCSKAISEGRMVACASCPTASRE
jgi:hypothetical protein